MENKILDEFESKKIIEINPPILKTWNRMYAVVLGINLFLILLFTYLTFKYKS
jgi:hypothetical protein